MWRAITHPLTPLAGLAAATTLYLCAFACAGKVPTAGEEWFIAIAWSLLLVLWIDADARQRRHIPCFEFGFLAAVYFPVSLLWYCVWSRGWLRGLLVLMAFCGLWVMPRFLAMLVWLLRYVVA